MEEVLIKVKGFVKKYNLLPIFFTLMSVASINFVTYVASFDINTFIILDASAVLGYIFGFTSLYIFTLAITTIMLTLGEYYNLFKPIDLLLSTTKIIPSTPFNVAGRVLA